MYSHSLLKSKKLNSCLKIVFYNVILISKKKKKKETIIKKMCYNTKKECTEMINLRKLILIVILSITTVSCSLLDNEAYQEMKRDRAESGRTCYERYDGHVYCEDKYGNRYY